MHDRQAPQNGEAALCRSSPISASRRSHRGSSSSPRACYRELLAEELYAFPDGNEPDAVYEAELREDLTYYYPQLRDYVTKAAAAKHGLLIWLE
jgi:hypothetical protein